MKSLQSAIQNRDLSALQGMMGADKPVSVRNEAAADLFNELFRQLRAAFPAAMATIKSQDDLNVLRQQWTLAFKENGINTVAQIEAGMSIARRQESPFLPAPGQFIAWCREGAMKAAGLPDEQTLVETVKRYSRQQDLYPTIEDFPWGSNAIYWMGKSLYFDMRENHWSDAQLRSAAKVELSNMIRRIQDGEVIPAPVTSIQAPHKNHKPLSGARGLEKIREVRAKLGLGRRSDG